MHKENKKNLQKTIIGIVKEKNKSYKKDSSRKSSRKRSRKGTESGTDDVTSSSSQGIQHVPDTATMKNPITSMNVSNNISASWSWGNAFASAAAVKPEDLGDEFNPFADSHSSRSSTYGGVMKVSQFVMKQKQEYMPSGCRKRKYDSTPGASFSSYEAEWVFSPSNSSITHDTSNNPLEDRLVNRGNGKDPIMVLGHKKKKIVSSRLKPTNHKHMQACGKLNEEGNIVLDDTGQEYDNMNLLNFPYPTDPDDHCESPKVAFEDIAPLLKKICTKNVKNNIKIYDPYYCDGAVVKHLNDLGFPSVHNKKEDCYRIWSDEAESESYPVYDVFLTNPPYSGDHIEKLMNHLSSERTGQRPWFLLMPQWVHKKDFYIKALTFKNLRPFYLVPKKRYVYLPPRNFREKRDSDVHKRSSPFVSMWFIWGGTQEQTEDLIKEFQKCSRQSKCDIARSRSALRDLRRKGSHSRKKNNK